MNNLTDSDESMLDETFGVDEDSGGIDLPAFAPARLQEAETLRASLDLETLRPAGVSTLREQVLNTGQPEQGCYRARTQSWYSAHQVKTVWAAVNRPRLSCFLPCSLLYLIIATTNRPVRY